MKCPKCGLENISTAIRCDCGYDFKSAQMKSSYLTSSLNTLSPASKGKRFLNFFIDIIVLYVISLFFGFITGIVLVILNIPFEETILVNIISYAMGYFICFIYYFTFESIFMRTRGKFITGTKVVKDDGTEPNVGTIAKRTISRFIPFEPLSIFSFSGCWHDSISNTTVVEIK